MSEDVDCKACVAGLALVWRVQSRKTAHLRGLATFSCKRIEAREQRTRNIGNDRSSNNFRGG